MQFFNEALNQIHLLNANNLTSTEEDCIRTLNGLLQKPTQANADLRDVSESSDKSEISTSNKNDAEFDDKNESCNAKSKEPKKFPFMQVYD